MTAKVGQRCGLKMVANHVLAAFFAENGKERTKTNASSASEYVQEATIVYHQIRIFPQQELPQIS